MSDQDLFNAEKETNEIDLNQIEDADQLLTHLKREDGTPRYNSTADAIRASIAAQEHIAKLERENAEFRAKQAESAVVEDILSKINGSKEEAPQEQPHEESASHTEVDLTMIDSRVEELLSAREQEALIKRNRDTFVALAQESFGENASEQVYGKLAEKFGMSKEEVNSDIEKNPAKVIALLGLQQTPANRQQKSPSVDPSALKGEQPKKGRAMQATTSAELVQEWRAHAN